MTSKSASRKSSASSAQVDVRGNVDQLLPRHARAQRRRHDLVQLCPGDGLAGGVQRDVVAAVDERVAQRGDDTLRAAVVVRRHRFVEGCDLGNLHDLCKFLPSRGFRSVYPAYPTHQPFRRAGGADWTRGENG